MREVAAERQAVAARIFFFFFSRSGEQFMPPPRDFRSGKGAWLSSRKNQAKMPGDLNKTDYERLVHLVLQIYSL